MGRSVKVFILIFCFCIFFTPFLRASDNPMLDFYGGLTEIVEKNMNNPSACVSESERYIKNNIGKVQKAAERGASSAKKNARNYEDMSPQEIEAAMKEAERAMSDPKIADAMNKSMEAMNRFMQAIQEFTQNHPDEGDSIMEALESYSSKGL